MIIRTLRISLLSLALFGLSCASSGPQVTKAERRASYPGCNAAQCKSWYDECSAECVNARSAGVTECENKCRGSVPDCEAACPG